VAERFTSRSEMRSTVDAPGEVGLHGPWSCRLITRSVQCMAMRTFTARSSWESSSNWWSPWTAVLTCTVESMAGSTGRSSNECSRDTHPAEGVSETLAHMGACFRALKSRETTSSRTAIARSGERPEAVDCQNQLPLETILAYLCGLVWEPLEQWTGIRGQSCVQQNHFFPPGVVAVCKQGILRHNALLQCPMQKTITG